MTSLYWFLAGFVLAGNGFLIFNLWSLRKMDANYNAQLKIFKKLLNERI